MTNCNCYHYTSTDIVCELPNEVKHAVHFCGKNGHEIFWSDTEGPILIDPNAAEPMFVHAPQDVLLVA
jgi:hypothetical protein